MMASATARACAPSRPKTMTRVLWSSIGSRPSSLADVLAPLQSARWHADRTSERSLSKLFRITCVDEHRRAVDLVEVDDRLELDLGRATERSPYRNAELVAPDVREACG